jgi:hypothetical protein
MPRDPKDEKRAASYFAPQNHREAFFQRRQGALRLCTALFVPPHEPTPDHPPLERKFFVSGSPQPRNEF